MKSNRLAWAALLLWAITVATLAWYFVRGATSPGTDQRTAVLLAPAERDLILAEMRGLLAGVHGILDGINRSDMKQVATAARAIGMASATEVNPALMAKLPLALKELGLNVHRDMDALAKSADDGKSAAELQKMLVESLGKCVACHAAWQLRLAQ